MGGMWGAWECRWCGVSYVAPGLRRFGGLGVLDNRSATTDHGDPLRCTRAPPSPPHRTTALPRSQKVSKMVFREIPKIPEPTGPSFLHTGIKPPYCATTHIPAELGIKGPGCCFWHWPGHCCLLEARRFLSRVDGRRRDLPEVGQDREALGRLRYCCYQTTKRSYCFT